jgi:hypothetical protein
MYAQVVSAQAFSLGWLPAISFTPGARATGERLRVQAQLTAYPFSQIGEWQMGLPRVQVEKRRGTLVLQTEYDRSLFYRLNRLSGAYSHFRSETELINRPSFVTSISFDQKPPKWLFTNEPF